MTQTLDTCDPKSYTDARGNLEWDQAIQHEINSLDKNHTWDLVPRPTGNNIVKCRWVYQTKFTSDGSIQHHKAYLVAKLFSQQEDIDYIETFSLVVKVNSAWLILSLSTLFGWPIHQMDVKSAFLLGDLDGEIYMEPPLGFVTNPTLVCHLKKSLYGLK